MSGGNLMSPDNAVPVTDQERRPLCFVVMGFGKKTDYSGEPRTLDLDATYDAIIEPAVLACGLRCVRADKVRHSGYIDQPMYEMLLRADLVIADISTANPNALYELGVRHALRPFATILMKEIEGKFLFDLNHLATFQYKHLGEDIGTAEAKKRKVELEGLIRTVMAEQRLDSPVFTFLKLPRLPPDDARLEESIRKMEITSNDLSEALESGRRAFAASNPGLARECFSTAREIQNRERPVNAPPDPYIVQQLALATYKCQLPNPLQALQDAWEVLKELSPMSATDPETLGIAGAIQKRLYEQQGDPAQLELAIELYGRGFEVKRDYYNGENYALCLDWRALKQEDPVEAQYDRMTACKVRQRIIKSLSQALADRQAVDRSDYKWMLATMANTYLALGDAETASRYELQFRTLLPPPAAWELDTFGKGKAYAQSVATKSS
jgi:tetratricopeptide (TPR) repeat protein